MSNDKTGSTSPNPTVTGIGERKIIEIIANYLEAMPNSPVPFGDDVAAVKIDQKQVAVLKTDMLVGKTDVPQERTEAATMRVVSDRP